MESSRENNKVLLNLSNDEPIVLLDWLTRFNKEEHSLLFQDQSEQRVLFDLEAIIEKVVAETFQDNYMDILMKAREKIKDQDEG